MHLVDKPCHSFPNSASKWRQHKLPCQPHWYRSKGIFLLLLLLLPKTFSPIVIPNISSNGSTWILTTVLQAKINGLETGLLCIIISPQCFGIICESTWGWIYIYHLSLRWKASVDLRQRCKHFIFSFTATELVWLGKKTVRNMRVMCLKEAEYNNTCRNNFVLETCTFFKHEKLVSSFAVCPAAPLCSERRDTKRLSADTRESTGHFYTSGEHSVAAVNTFMFPNCILGQAASWETKWSAGPLFESIQMSFISNNHPKTGHDFHLCRESRFKNHLLGPEITMIRVEQDNLF